jgi:uncharacterized membrane protein
MQVDRIFMNHAQITDQPNVKTATPPLILAPCRLDNSYADVRAHNTVTPDQPKTTPPVMIPHTSRSNNQYVSGKQPTAGELHDAVFVSPEDAMTTSTTHA